MRRRAVRGSSATQGPMKCAFEPGRPITYPPGKRTASCGKTSRQPLQQAASVGAERRSIPFRDCHGVSKPFRSGVRLFGVLRIGDDRPAFNHGLVDEAQLFVKRFAHAGGIELHAPHAAFVEVSQRVLHQSPCNPLAAILGQHEHHADPRQILPIKNRRRRARYDAISLVHPAALRLDRQQVCPVAGRLVPASRFLQAHSRRNIFRSHQTDHARINFFWYQ